MTHVHRREDRTKGTIAWIERAQPVGNVRRDGDQRGQLIAPHQAHLMASAQQQRLARQARAAHPGDLGRQALHRAQAHADASMRHAELNAEKGHTDAILSEAVGDTGRAAELRAEADRLSCVAPRCDCLAKAEAGGSSSSGY